jgi:SAM-dependent methyltransferase
VLASTTALLNRNMPVFDWYLMPESYSAPLIYDAINEFGGNGPRTVLDPFCGTGTTLLAARNVGYDALGIEVNPFLCFASRVKTRETFDHCLLEAEVEKLLEAARAALSENGSREIEGRYDLPDMPRLERWISRRVALKVVALRACIEEHVSEANREVALLALAAILRGVSNMKLSPHAFGSREVKQDAPVLPAFEARLRKMLTDVEWLRTQRGLGRTRVVEGDVRRMHGLDEPLLPARLAITSPPYLNNLDYTMQTRLELFFLGFVRDMEELKQIRKRMMICDAKATYKDIEDWRRVEEVRSIARVAQQIDERLGDRGWGWDYGRMTRQYFGGLLKALEAIRPMLASGAHLVMVVGESAHAGVLVPVPDLVAELGERAGYRREAVRVLRTRRSSSHRIGLQESAVVMRNE